MVISQPALICLSAAADRLRRGLAICGLRQQARPSVGAAETAPSAPAGPVEGSVGYPGGVSEEQAAAPNPLTAGERRARAAAFRALLLARQRRFDAARSAFVEAARLDPALDLTTVPTFWLLERGAHEAAIAAYEETGRGRDALLLTARLEQVYRPRLVPATRSAATQVS